MSIRIIRRLIGASFALTLGASAAAAPPPADPHPLVALDTTKGTIVIELDRARAPLTVENFLKYVRAGFYDGTIFHRVIPGFVAQGGGFTADFHEKDTRPPIPNESGNGLSNVRGTIAMAREPEPHTATAQFYINLVDNLRLDPQPNRWGYAVFGQVVKGMEVVDEIAKIATGPAGPFSSDVPVKAVVIEKAKVVSSADGKTGE
ncbi:MAG TPA: peptidylprolyl isomerase [Gammaproteobacteria bacterium]|nr:peptidylprolyl isomerase [Gammaproteobacteria bacterium]